MKVAIVGGGPGGLYFARLLKRARPADDVRVFEQNPPHATFGFGVGLGGRTMREIATFDPDVYERLTAAMLFDNRQVIHLNGEDLLLTYAQAKGSVERLALLKILLDACHECGVETEHHVRIESAAQLDGFDLIVAADGVNSTLRREREDAFGTHVRELTNHFAWYGVGHAMEPDALVFRTTPAGRFVAHYYAYTPAMSTFVAECDDATWHRAGLEAMSDDERRRTFESLFAAELDGADLIDNRSIWRRFPVVTNDRWFNDNVVLVGDALRSAHFSIGSGTRLAMEDASALFTAVQEAGDDVQAALRRYVELRQPMRDAFGEAAERSFDWYEDIENRMQQTLIDFTYDFLTRTGRIDDARLRTYVPEFFTMYTDSRRTRQPA